ncbi:MAG TPA: hypothetical protein VMU84_09640 [Thermoanaerobaculia bacterium]|nr:hypothetical protein [Thermoanaerobaculia bacterium]
MPHAGVRVFVALYAVAAMLWLIMRRATLRFGAIVVIAIALRAPLMFSDPQLSNDVYRYLWDGHALASGVNPYAHAPDDPRINHPEIPTIYPPHAELLFVLARNLFAWRVVIVAFDLLALFMLRSRPRAALAYATFPLLLFEGTWSGHVDAVAASLLLIAFLRDSGAAAGAAVGMKVIPIATVPALFLRSKSRWRFAGVFAAVLILPMIPFVIAGPLMPGMRDYATRWIFNSPLYEIVFRIVDRIPLKEYWTAIKDPLHLEIISDWVYRHVYADFVTRCVMAAIALVLILRRPNVTRSIGALLLCAPAIHPWYWLVLAPVAIVEESAWIYVALCAPASYLLYLGAPKLLVFALCYALPLTARLRPSAFASSVAGWRSAATRFRRARDTSRS